MSRCVVFAAHESCIYVYIHKLMVLVLTQGYLENLLLLYVLLHIVCPWRRLLTQTAVPPKSVESELAERVCMWCVKVDDNGGVCCGVYT